MRFNLGPFVSVFRSKRFLTNIHVDKLSGLYSHQQSVITQGDMVKLYESSVQVVKNSGLAVNEAVRPYEIDPAVYFRTFSLEISDLKLSNFG